MPTRPPSSDSTTASTRNCSSTSRSSAPMARRMPISRVRSVTDTSMMFMMPMPPTEQAHAGDGAEQAGQHRRSSPVSVCGDLLHVARR